MRLIVTIYLLILTNYAISQQNSYVYNNKGQLLCDTTISISNEAFDIWKECEESFFTEILDFQLNPILKEIGSMSVILSFHFDTINDFYGLKIIKYLDRNKHNDSVEFLFIKCISDCLSKIDNYRIINPMQKATTNMIFYLPINYKSLSVNNFITNQGVLEVKDVEYPLIKPDSKPHR